MRPNIFPTLRYHNARAAIDWLIQAFAFTPHAEHAGPGDTIAHAELGCGPSTVGISSVTGETADNPWSGVRQAIYVVVPDPDAHHDRATRAGAEIIMPLRDMEYGSREYGARDPGGHLWGFGTYDMAAGDGEPTIFPEVHYGDPRKGIQFLTDAFGFDKTFEVPGPGGSTVHAELQFGSGVVMTGGLPEPGSEWAGVDQLVCVYVDDPDAHHARAKAGGATIAKAPENTPFGARHYAARDPEGFLWWFSSYKPARRG